MHTYTIRDHLLHIDGVPVSFRETPNCGGRMRPSLVVLHDTAGRLMPGSSVDWLCNPAARASAHLVIERDGSVTQLAEFDRVTWHAGVSTWDGVKGVNGRSIGIELTNPGRLTPRGTGKAAAWFGEVYDIAATGIEARTTTEHGDGLWMPYTAAQIDALERILAAIEAAYPIREVLGHFQVAAGRKVDPTPLLPDHILGISPGADPQAADPLVQAAQTRLDELGYTPGLADGDAGPRTAAATHAFQRENGLTPTGTLDGHTRAALEAPAAKPMPTGARADITAADLAKSSRTIAEQTRAQLEGWLQVVTGLKGVVLAVLTLLTETGRDVLAALGPGGVLALGAALLVVFGGLAVMRSGRTISYRVDDARTGKHLGGTRV
jgi:N-acetylmuramoyl-L-alanine amidase